MRLATVATATAMVALPLVAAVPVGHLEERQLIAGVTSLVGGLIDDITGGPVLPTTSVGPTSAVVPSSVKPSSAGPTTAAPTSQPPTSVAPSSVAPSSVPPSSTSEAPLPSSTEPSESPSPTPSPSESPSPTSAEVKTSKTVVDGVTVWKTETYMPSETASSKSSNKDDGPALSTGAIVGIAVGGAAAVIGVIVAIVMLSRRRTNSEDEAIRWPELNRHGDADTHTALPAREVGEKRMSLGSDYDGPTYQSDENHAGGSNYVGPDLYDDAAVSYPPGSQTQYVYDHGDNYSTFPPAVQPQPSPVHGAPFDWESSEGAYQGYPADGYNNMARQESPPMGSMAMPSPNVPNVQPGMPYNHPSQHY